MSELLTDGLPGWPGWRADRADHLYRLADPGGGEASDFAAGTLGDGRQGVMGAWGSDTLVCLLFAPDGAPAEVLTRAVPPPPADADADADPWERDVGWARRQVPGWQRDLGWRPGPVRVRRFLHADNPICIADYPRWAIRFLADPVWCYPGPADRAATAADLAAWEESGSFVFRWGREFYVDRDGQVVAT